VDLALQSPRGRLLIEAYGDGRFRVSGAVHTGSLLLSPQRALPWAVESLAALTAREIFESMAPLLEPSGVSVPEILLIGCGPRGGTIPDEARALFRERRIVVEPMDTGAACRTYNVLAAEDRLVAAALIAV
jgi:uncharacterized protein